MKPKKKNGIATFTANSVEEVREAARLAEEILKLSPDDEELWYRGLSDHAYSLIPSLQRLFTLPNPPKRKLRHLEQDLFFEFLTKARHENHCGMDHWDVLFLMQHYRAPTRLLDWTEVLYVALYFAVNYLRCPEERTPRVYVMNPYLWNKKQGAGDDLYFPRFFGYDAKEDYYYEFGELLVEKNGIDWKNPIALYPPQRDIRLSAQHGYFTIHGKDPRPMEEIAPELLVAIDLTANAVKDAKETLRACGINEYALFPDLEGLSRHLLATHGLPVPYPRY